MTYKLCSKCKHEKPATLEYFHSNKATKSGFHHWCIECRTGKPRQWTPRLLGFKEGRKQWRRERRRTLYGYLADNLHNSIYDRHRKRFECECDLSVEYLLKLWENQQGKCYWTGIEMKWGDVLPHAHPQKLSFDRIDCDKGYIVGNVVLATNFANRGRGTMKECEYKEFLKMLGISP